MRSPPERVDEAVIGAAVAAGWGLTTTDLRYVPEGAGAYHWTARGDDGRQWFVTCDDLDTKPWLGSDRATVFDGLLAAYGTAMELRAAGLAFVAAPLASVSGVPAERVDERHSVSVSAFVDGEPGRWGRIFAPRARRELVTMLARLHRATAATPTGRGLPRRGLDLPGRPGFEAALDDLGRPWDGGPLSEPMRHLLAGHRDLIARWLADLDRAATRLGATDATAVVTHGEPHPGNLIRRGTGLVLVDWDTVALARPERDLWMVAGVDGALLATYRDLTGVALDRDALAAYRLLWALSDLASYTAQLRGGHRRSADAERGLTALHSVLDGREPAPYGVPADRPASPT